MVDHTVAGYRAPQPGAAHGFLADVSRTEAETEIVYALASGRITDPALELLATATVRFKDGEKQPVDSTPSSAETEAEAAP